MQISTEFVAADQNRAKLLRLAERVKEAEQAEQEGVLKRQQQFEERLQALENGSAKASSEMEVAITKLKGQMDSVGTQLHAQQVQADQIEGRQNGHVKELEEIAKEWIHEQQQESEQQAKSCRQSATAKLNDIGQSFRQSTTEFDKRFSADICRTNLHAEELVQSVNEASLNHADSNVRIADTLNTQLGRFTHALLAEEHSRTESTEAIKHALAEARQKLLLQIKHEHKQREEISHSMWTLLEKACDKLQAKLC